MINAIIGKLSGFSEDHILIQNFGIEWKIFVSNYSLEKLKEQNETELVYIECYLHIFENGQNLYGFALDGERTLFLSLIKIQGVGPKQAIKILSSMNYKDIVLAVNMEDEKAFANVSGIGRKTAQKIVLSLKEDKNLQNITDFEKPEESSNIKDIVESLIEMGFERKSVIRTVNRIVKKNPSKDEKDILKICIIELSSN